MLAFRALKLEEINSIYAQEGLEKNELNGFAKVFGEYYANAQAKLAQSSASTTKYSERNIAGNELARFFDALGFQTQIDQESGAQSVNSAIDLALLQNGSVKVIIEAKLPESISKSKQMFSAQNPNCKALHEAILYYLREVVDKQNFSVETIIITDFTRFFIFGYKEFERLFAKNAKIKDIFAKYKNDTSNFYAKAQAILEGFDDEICGVCVDLSNLAGLSKANSTTLAQSTTNQNPSQNATQSQNFATNATNTTQALTSKGKKSLETLCKIFHKDFLFGEFKQSNPLSPRFYNELLYILGLSEYKRSGKILILPSKESLEGANTLYHLIITQLQATHPSEVQNLDFVMQYIILWLNRILFLKLIEANLVRFNDDKALAFLNKSKLKDYQALSHLFFEILAKEHSKRPKDSPLAYLPHLNSSLFERQPCEEVLEISMLDNSAEFSYYATTQVRKEGKRQAGKVNLLSYIFEFLDAFDFGSGENETRNNDTSGYNEGEDFTIIEQKELIKTNVLGLVFEKLNGYKEGSFYTPNFITSYMCRISLEQVVLEKFNEANPKWNATNLAQLAELIRDERERKDEFKAILRGVRICDPSVGSGHFLVSALCEMIRIYHSLRLSDELNEYDLKIDDDEIIIYVAKDKVFDYKKPTKPNENSQAVQKCLFTLKKSIIQNNLFGVDINPNSVEICKLRLWIELLKNSYYLTEISEGFDESLRDSYHQMQTLPNIDINIKCGNSLISRFSLQDSLRHIPNIDKQIKDYQKLVLDYKHSDQSELKASKKDIESKIINLKETFKLTLKDPKTKASLEKAIKNHIRDFGMFMLDDESLLDGIGGYIGNLFDDKNLSDEEQKQAATSYANIKYLRHKLDSALSGEEYKNAFEWRFEFPEVLDNSNGDFIGFDLVIGNPPYISTLDLSKSDKQGKDIYRKIYPDINGLYDIYILFILLGLRVKSKNGSFIWIVPNKFLIAEYAEEILDMLLENKLLSQCVDVSNVNTFKKASVYPIIILGNNNSKFERFYIESQDDLLALNLKQSSHIDWDRFKTFADFGLKIQSGLAGFQAHSIVKFLTNKKTKNAIPFAVSGSIDKYILDTKKVTYMKQNYKNPYIIPNNAVSSDKWKFWQNEKIVIAGMTKQLESYYAKTPLAIGVGVYAIYDFAGLNPLLILGILNSKFMNYVFVNKFKDKHLAGGYLGINKNNLETLPIFNPNTKNKKIADKIVNLVSKILESKRQGEDSADLENQINDLVYKLYNLDSKEIQIIQGS